MGCAQKFLHRNQSVQATLEGLVFCRLNGSAAGVLRMYVLVFKRLLRLLLDENLNFGELGLKFRAC